MKFTITLFALFLNSFTFGQHHDFFTSFVEEDSLAEKGIRAYTVRMKNHAYEDHNTNGLVLEQATFDKKGKKTFHYRYHRDVVNSTDSLFYTYDKSGRLIEIKAITNDAPVGADQIALLTSLGAKNRRISTIFFQYNEKGQLSQKTFYLTSSRKLPEINRYFYNSDGLLIREEEEISVAPGKNHNLTLFHYDTLQRLIQKDQVYLSRPSDTLRSTKTYDGHGNLVHETNRTNALEEQSEFQYEYDGIYVSKTTTVTYLGEEYERVIHFFSYPEERWKEEKEYVDGELRRWNRHVYGEDGLKKAEHDMMPDSGYMFQTIEIEYKKKKK